MLLFIKRSTVGAKMLLFFYFENAPKELIRMSEEIVRIYRMEDEAMLVRAEVIHDQLLEGLANFNLKFPFMDTAYQTALKASIDAANALPLDSQVVSNLKVLTQDVNAQVLLGRQALAQLGIYAQLTYPKDEARQRVFGQNKWSEAYKNQEKMISTLEQVYALVVSAPYDKDLAAKGFGVAEAAKLQTIATAIRSRNTLQENAKANRPITTHDRIVQYNSIWKTIKEVNLASKVVYAQDPARMELFVLYPNRRSNTTVHIRCTQGGVAVQKASVALSNTSLATRVTDENGFVHFKSVNMPERLNIRIVTAGNENYVFNNQSIIKGTTNDLEIELA